jgi:hypothetical protein
MGRIQKFLMLNSTVHKSITGLYIILPPHLGLGLQSNVFHPAYSAEMLYEFLMSLTRATFPAHLLRDLNLELDLRIVC